MKLKKLVIKIVLLFGIFVVGFAAFPKNAEAAKVESVVDYYYRDYYIYDAQYSPNYNVTTKVLRFNTGYTRGAATKKQVSASIAIRTFKYTYSYYTY